MAYRWELDGPARLEPKGNDVQRTVAVRLSPDYHAQLSMVAQVDGMSLTDLMMTALDNHMAARREAPDFKAKAQVALEEAEAQMARTQSMLLATLPEAESTGEGALPPKHGKWSMGLIFLELSLVWVARGYVRQERQRCAHDDRAAL